MTTKPVLPEAENGPQPQWNSPPSDNLPQAIEFASFVSAQRHYFLSGATLSYSARVSALKELRKAVHTYQDQLSQALYADLRKSSAEAWVTEIGFVVHEIAFVLKQLETWMRVKRTPGSLLLWPSESEIRYEPHGVCLIIAPWNYPVQLSLSPLVGALAAGNTVILKPSEYTPQTSEVLQRMLQTTFLPEFVKVVTGGAETSQLLLKEAFDFIFFTGGTEIGKVVMHSAAERLTPFCLELGGKSPCIIARDVDFKKSLKRVLWGKFLNAGQTCVAPDYLYVPEEKFSEVKDVAQQILTEFYGLDPQRSEDYGRIVNERHLDRLQKLIPHDRVLLGGRSDVQDRYLSPTLIGPVSWDDACMQDEIFGPILPVLTYKTLNEVYSQIRQRSNPLAAYIFTSDSPTEVEFLKEVKSGGACINDTVLHLSDLHLPFGGRGPSGIGAYHGRKSFECFSHERSILKRRFSFDWKFRYPPLTGMREKLLRLMMKLFS